MGVGCRESWLPSRRLCSKRRSALISQALGRIWCLILGDPDLPAGAPSEGHLMCEAWPRLSAQAEAASNGLTDVCATSWTSQAALRESAFLGPSPSRVTFSKFLLLVSLILFFSHLQSVKGIETKKALLIGPFGGINEIISTRAAHSASRDICSVIIANTLDSWYLKSFDLLKGARGFIEEVESQSMHLSGRIWASCQWGRRRILP